MRTFALLSIATFILLILCSSFVSAVAAPILTLSKAGGTSTQSVAIDTHPIPDVTQSDSATVNNSVSASTGGKGHTIQPEHQFRFGALWISTWQRGNIIAQIGEFDIFLNWTKKRCLNVTLYIYVWQWPIKSCLKD